MPPDNEEAIGFGIRALRADQVQVVKDYLKLLLEGDYSDEDLTMIFWECLPRFVYKGEAQRKFVQQMYNTIAAMGVFRDRWGQSVELR